MSGESVIEDLSQRAWSIGDSVVFRLRDHYQVFIFEGRPWNLAVESNLPFSEQQSSLRRQLEIDSEISIFLNDAEVDLDTTIADLELGDGETLRIERRDIERVTAIAPVTYSIILLIGVIPRMASFKLSPTATLAIAEPMIKDRWCLGELEIEFGLLDDASDIPAIIPKSSVIGNLDLKDCSLIVRPSANIDSSAPAISEFGGCAEDFEDDGDGPESRLLQSIHATIGSVEPGAMRYGFVCDDEVFHICFPAGARVGDARWKVAERFKTRPESVALHFMGKALRDGFALDRLRLGTSRIGAYVTSDREILVMTAKANRL
jgi:hypothetical protein